MDHVPVPPGVHRRSGWIPASGWTWALSIVGLVVVMRAAMIPLFVKQIMASRKMQMIQPELQKIQKKYKGKSRPRVSPGDDPGDDGALQEGGDQPLQLVPADPGAVAVLLRRCSAVLNGLDEIASGATKADRPDHPAGGRAVRVGDDLRRLAVRRPSSDGRDINVKIVTSVLIVLMSATTFLTQRQLMTKNMPASALDNPFAKQQKLLLYMLPIVFAVSGVNFPIGVLIYWFTTNVWSMCQQFYVIRRMPAPGSAAEKALPRAPRAKGKPIPGAAAPRPRRRPRRPRPPSGQAVRAAPAADLQEAQEDQGRRREAAARRRQPTAARTSGRASTQAVPGTPKRPGRTGEASRRKGPEDAADRKPPTT